MTAQTTPLTAQITKFGGALSAGILLVDASTEKPLAAHGIKFGGGLSDEMLLADGSADEAFGCPGHQV